MLRKACPICGQADTWLGRPHEACVMMQARGHERITGRVCDAIGNYRVSVEELRREVDLIAQEARIVDPREAVAEAWLQAEQRVAMSFIEKRGWLKRLERLVEAFALEPLLRDSIAWARFHDGRRLLAAAEGRSRPPPAFLPHLERGERVFWSGEGSYVEWKEVWVPARKTIIRRAIAALLRRRPEGTFEDRPQAPRPAQLAITSRGILVASGHGLNRTLWDEVRALDPWPSGFRAIPIRARPMAFVSPQRWLAEAASLALGLRKDEVAAAESAERAMRARATARAQEQPQGPRRTGEGPRFEHSRSSSEAGGKDKIPQRKGEMTAARALEILELPPGATPEEATRAYRRLARLYHPDLAMKLEPHHRQLVEAKMVEINAARAVLEQHFART